MFARRPFPHHAAHPPRGTGRQGSRYEAAVPPRRQPHGTAVRHRRGPDQAPASHTSGHGAHEGIRGPEPPPRAPSRRSAMRVIDRSLPFLPTMLREPCLRRTWLSSALLRATALELIVLAGHLLLYPAGITSERRRPRAPVRAAPRAVHRTGRYPGPSRRDPRPAARRPAPRVHRQPLRLRPAAPLPRPARLAPSGVAQLLAADLRHPYRRRAARPAHRGDLRPHRAPRGRHRRAQPRRPDRPLLRAATRR